MVSDDDDDDELLLVQQLPMDMGSEDHAGQGRRLAHLLPPLAGAASPASPHPFRPPPPPAAAAAADSRVAFRGWLGAPRYWDLWVAKLRPIHERLWRELGILDAVLASTYRFKRDSAAVLHVASFWCPGNNTFAFPWGEATLTLQDMAVLGGFPADGSPAPAPLQPEWRPDEAALNGVRLGFNRSACKKAHHSAWVKHFLMDTATAAAAAAADADVVLEHAAFLALWLTRFVLPGHPESTMRQSLFPVAVRLARGDRVALAPAVLASLYRDLREMKDYLVAAGAAATGELLPPLSVYAPLYILQLWVWERFPAFWTGKVNPAKDGEPRAARWHDLSKKMNQTVIREVLSSGKNFVWQPYTSSLQKHGWLRGNDVAGNDKVRSFVHCLRACELVGFDCIEQYLPHRVAMQFGLDQDVPGDVRRANENWTVAWETYDLEGKSVAFFIPQSEPWVTARYAQWWKQPLSPYLDVGALSIDTECKASKRKVKKTPAAMEAEAEKERKLKKARISPNDKKRKLEELYDAKLTDWLVAARNENSGIGGGSKKKPQESPQAGIVECGEHGSLMDSEDEQKEVPQSLKVGYNTEVEKYLNLTKKGTGEMPMEISEDEKAELEEHNILTKGGAEEHKAIPEADHVGTAEPKGGAEEEHKEFPEKDHVDMAEPMMHTEFDTDKYAEMDVTKRLTGRGADGKPIDVSEVNEVDAETDVAMRLTGRDADGKLIDVPEVNELDAEKEKAGVPIEEGTDERLTEISEVDVLKGSHAEKEKARVFIEEGTDERLTEISEVDVLEDNQSEKEKARVLIEDGTDERLTEVSEVDHVEVGEPKGLIKECTDEKFDEVPELENIGIGGTPETMEQDADDKPNETHSTIEDAEGGQGEVLTGNVKSPYIGKITLVDQVDPKEPAHAQGIENDEDTVETSVDKDTTEASVDMDTTEASVDKDTMKAYVKDTMEASVDKDTVEASVDKDTMEASVDKDTVEASGDKDTIEASVDKDTMETSFDKGTMEASIDKDMMKASNYSISGMMSCSSVITQSEGNQKEALDEGIRDKQCIQGVEFVNESEQSSNAAAIKVAGIYEHKALDMHEEVSINVIEEGGTICENKETQILVNSHNLENSLESDLVIQEVGEIQDIEGIQNQETLDLDKQQTVEERHNLGTTVENKRTKDSEDTIMPGYHEFLTNSPGTEINEVKSTKGMQDQEHLDIKDEQAMETTLEYEITDGVERPLEEANALDNGGVDATVVAIGISEVTSIKGMQNQDICSREEASEDNQHPGDTNVNEKRILGDTSRTDSGGSKFDATIVGVDWVEPRDGTQNQGALNIGKEPALQGKQDHEMLDENTARILVDMDAPKCVEVKPDMTTKVADETLPTEENFKMAGDKSCWENQQEGVPLDGHNKSDVEGSESTQTARKDFDEAPPPELENQVEVKQEKLENITEKSICRGNDESSEQYQTSPEEATISPSVMDDQGENKKWAEESTKNYDKYASDSVSTGCQPSKFGRPSIEEVRRIHFGRSIYMKDIKESQGRIRSEPSTSNRTHVNNAGYSRHSVQETVLVSKDIKVPLHDSSRVCGRDHALELVVTGPPEETSRWRQEQCALQILEDVQNSRIAEKTRMEMEIRMLKAQIASMQKQVMNLDHFSEVISRSKSLRRH